jgi:hypothetical protein
MLTPSVVSQWRDRTSSCGQSPVRPLPRANGVVLVGRAAERPISLSDRTSGRPTSNCVRALLVITAALLTGCAAGRTQSLPTEPLRRLDTLVVYDASYKLAEVEQCVNVSSLRFKNEFGICIVPVEYRVFAWEPSDSTRELLRQVRCLNPDDRYDMVIGFTRRTPKVLVSDSLFGGWAGVTDDVCRRYIVMKSADSYALTHELLHTFVFAFDHESQLGQLSKTQINLVPFVPEASIKSDAISDAVYAEVMRNKWREFRAMGRETR